MIKNYHRRKLSVTASHRTAILRNMATSLLLHEKIKTTFARAKEVASFSERLITLARPSDLNAKKAVAREIKDEQVRKKLFDVLVPRYKDRQGGYTQVFRMGLRRGDAAQMAVIRLIV
jgi:large subunit ribosomal protein L17